MTEHIAGGIGHVDVAGPDIGALGTFYAAVLGWAVEPRGSGYASLRTPAGSPDGALVEAPVGSITVGVVVADLGLALEASKPAGGDVVMPATDNGWVTKGQVVDPAGNIITLIQA